MNTSLHIAYTIFVLCIIAMASLPDDTPEVLVKAILFIGTACAAVAVLTIITLITSPELLI